MSFDILWRCALCMVVGWFIGFFMTRSALKQKYNPEGLLKIAYDVDDPSHPAMGLEIESLHYVLTHNTVVLTIQKIGFPKDDRRISLRSAKDKSA